MSQLEKPVPPAGEEIHLPGGSLQPLLLTVGITMALRRRHDLPEVPLRSPAGS